MYMQLDTKLSSITDGLVEKLRKYKAIDENNNIISERKFNKLIELTISYCESLLPMVEHDGIVFDRYGFNLIFSRINVLRDMKLYQSVYPYTSQIKQIIPRNEAKPEPGIFQQIRQKILARFQRTY